MNFRPPEELAVKLRQQAESEHTSVQAVLVKAAEEYLARHNKRRAIDEALDLILVESADAIRRLGE